MLAMGAISWTLLWEVWGFHRDWKWKFSFCFKLYSWMMEVQGQGLGSEKAVSQEQLCSFPVLWCLAGGSAVLGEPPVRCHDLRLQQWDERLHQSHGGRRAAPAGGVTGVFCTHSSWETAFQTQSLILFSVFCLLAHFHFKGEIMCDMCSLFHWMQYRREVICNYCALEHQIPCWGQNPLQN